MLVNWPLIKNPLNWLTIVLMLTIAGYLYHILEQNLSTNSAT